MMLNFGDIAVNAVVHLPFNSNRASGSSVAPGSNAATGTGPNGTIQIYKDNGTTPRASSSGVTYTESFNSVTGLNFINIDTSDNTTAGFYAAGHDYFVVLNTADIDGQTVSACIGIFSIQNRSDATLISQLLSMLQEVGTSSSYRFTTSALSQAPTGGSAPTVSQIATAVWQDATGSDFTAANSIGKSLYTSGVVPGGTNGLFIAGTNAATTITTALTTTFTGNLTGTVGNLAAGAKTDVENAVWNATSASHESAGTTGLVIHELSTTLQEVGTHDQYQFTTTALANGPSGGGGGPTAAQIATAVWQDTTSGDFTTVGSIGKSLFTSGAVPGAAGGLVIAGSNAATTFAGLTTGALSCTTITASGAVAFQSTFAVTTSTALGALSCTTLTASGAVAFQSTFGVTGTMTVNAFTCSNNFLVSGTTTFTGVVTASNASNSILGVTLAAGSIVTATFGTCDFTSTMKTSLNTSVDGLLTVQMAESYAADGVAPTLAQSLFLIQQALTEFSISGTTLTGKKLDGSTLAFVLTLNSGTAPTAVTRSA
jgi:hypothetical protein